MFTYVDVIERAIEIVNRGNPPFEWSDEGECCPWCAISTAKTELDTEHGTGLSFIEALSFFHEEVASDEPLVFARKALAKWNDVDPYSITKVQAIEILLQAKKVIIIDASNTACTRLFESGGEIPADVDQSEGNKPAVSG